MDNYGFLFWAYNVIWIGLVGYVAWLMLRLRQAERRIERLERDGRSD